MRVYYALVHHERDSAFGISFPDLRGCFSAADDEADVLQQAQEALGLFVEGQHDLPQPRSITQLHQDQEVAADLAAGAFLIAVPLVQSSRKGRYNVILESALVEGVDEAAKAAGISRSEFIARAASRSLKDLLGAVVQGPVKRRVGEPRTSFSRQGGSELAMKKSESTGSKAATAAAKVMKDPKASKQAKTAAASALTQSKSRETTSPKAASAAAKVMRDPKASKQAKTAAASALTQKAGKK